MAMFQKAHCAIAPDSLFCKGLAETDVQLYKLFGGECAQTTLNQNYESIVEKATGMQEGNCSALGYTVDQGQKVFKLPVVGEIDLALYAKPGKLEAGEEATLYRIALGECGEATVPTLAEGFLEKYAEMVEGTCSAQGYTVEDKTESIKTPAGEITLSLYKKSASDLGATPATAHRVIKNECGQIVSDSWIEPMLEKYAQFVDGTCASVGYTHVDGEKKMNLPVVGEVDVELFSKPANKVGEEATLYRVIQGECGEANVPTLAEGILEKWGGMVEGTCLAQGYAVEEQTKSINSPFGKWTLTIYKKSASDVGATPATTHRVIKNECGQVTTNPWIEPMLEKYAQFVDGTCASVGYTHVDGDQKIVLPVVGEVEVELFSKPADSQQTHKHGIRAIMEKINKFTGHHSKHHHGHHKHHYRNNNLSMI